MHFHFYAFHLKVFLLRVRFEPSEAEQLPYRIISFTARRVSLIDHMHLFCCTLCRYGFTHAVCLKALDDYMTYTTFWITFVGSKELAGFLFQGGVGGGWGDVLAGVVVGALWRLGFVWGVLVCASDDESEDVFLEAIKVSVKIYSHLVQIIVVK